MFMAGLAARFLFSFSIPEWLNRSADRAQDAAAYSLDLVRDEQGLRSLRQPWAELIGRSRSHERIYQSPEYFAFTRDASDAATAKPALLCFTRTVDESVAGLVPARMTTVPLEFKVGPMRLLTVRLPVVQLLGSVPMVVETMPRHILYRCLLDRFPAARAVYMQALPREHFPDHDTGGLRWSAVNGWRKCLGVDIDGDYDSYLKGLPSKKRYNMTRQIRQLEQEAGPLLTTAITTAGQAPQLRAALDAVLDAGEAAAYPGMRYFERLANNGLLHSYVISAASGPLAVVIGTRYHSTWHVHNIFTAQAHARLSPGTSAFLLALKDAAAGQRVARVEFGYGSPNREFRSTHTAEVRAQVLASRRAGVGMLVTAHGWLQRANDGASTLVRRMRRTKARA